MATSGSLPTKKRRAIASLLQHPTIGEAAESCGIGERTLYRWMTEREFSSALHRAESELIGGALRTIAVDLSANYAVMQAIRDKSNNPPSVRLRAAIALDNSLFRWYELQALEQRISNLEREVYSVKR